MNINEKAIREGMAKANAMIAERTMVALNFIGEELLMDASIQKEYRNLTGNTLTSLAFGRYVNFKIAEIVLFDADKPAQRRKFKQGETVYNYRDYDGRIRKKFTADIETDGGWGISTSTRFLRSFRPSTPNAIVVCTGTEYSEYLEEGDLNVLTNTKKEAAINGLSMFRNGFKKIK